jgi:hypothetical protein
MRRCFSSRGRVAVIVAGLCALLAVSFYYLTWPSQPRVAFRFSRGSLLPSVSGPQWMCVATNSGGREVEFMAEAFEYKTVQGWVVDPIPIRFTFGGLLSPRESVRRPFVSPQGSTPSISLAPTNSGIPWRVRFRYQESIDVTRLMSYFGHSRNVYCGIPIPWLRTVVSKEVSPGTEPAAAPNGGLTTPLGYLEGPEGRPR